MKGISDPVKALNNERITMQKKLDQKALERCYKYLEKENDDDIVFIAEKFVSLLKGSDFVSPQDVQSYFEKTDRINFGFSKFDFSKFTIDQYKDLLHELFGNRAKSLGIVRETSDNQYESTGIDFPARCKDFLVVYRLLILLCKYSIAKHDEAKVLKAIEKSNRDLADNMEKIDLIKSRIENVIEFSQSSLEIDQQSMPLALNLQTQVVDIKEGIKNLSLEINEDREDVNTSIYDKLNEIKDQRP